MLKRIWDYLNQVDYDSRQQLYGVRLLMLMAGLIMLLPLFFHFLIPSHTKVKSESELDSLKLLYAQKIDSISTVNPSYSYKNREKRTDYISYEDYQSKNAENYNAYNKTKDFSNQYSNESSSIPQEKIKFNLNSATVEDLKQVKGIGDVFAQRIIKYRERLGGFHSKNQLYEVYQIDSLVVQNTFDYLSGDLLPSAKLKINTEEFKVVLKHPYLEYKDVQVLFNNRPIASEDMLCRLLPNKCRKLSPYLDYSY